MVCQLWNFSIISVLVLTISNILLTIRLLHNSDCANSNRLHFSQQNSPTLKKPSLITNQINSNIDSNNDNNNNDYIQNDYDYLNNSRRLVFDKLNLNYGRWDASRQYKYFDFVKIGNEYEKLSNEYSVCLATQSSLERLHSLVSVAEHWNGPISLSIFIAGKDELYLLQLYMSYLNECFEKIRNTVTIHLAYPNNYPPKLVRKSLKNNYFDYMCDQPEQTLKKLIKLRSTETTKWRTRNPYPQNHMRNLARKGCQTDYVFLTDIDIIPSINFTQNLNKFLINNKCIKKCAYVVPTYEIDSRVKFPNSKEDLIRLSKKGLARPFHHKVFIYNQYATNFTRWESDGISSKNDTKISYSVTNFEFLYEPFYVSTDVVPPHDERFVGYGFTRNTQVYEMFVAGYTFQVLTPIFTCHWGLQNKKGRPSWRERQNNINRRQFEVFKKEIYARYHRDPLKMFQPNKNIKA